MESALVALVIAGGLAVVTLVAVLGYLAAKRRREALAALAAKHGWTYVERDDGWTERFGGSPFGHGFDRRATNVLTGAYDGRPCAVFDYRYSTRSTSTDSKGHTTTHTQHHPYSVIAIDTGASFPHLQVAPEGFVGRFLGRLTNTDIELESEDFNRAFTVTCPDRKFAFDVLHPGMMELLMTTPDLAWQLQDRHLLAIRPGAHSEPEVEATLGAVDAIVDRVPDFVWRDVLGQVPPAQHTGEDAT